MALEIRLRKTNTGQQALSLLGQMIWTKLSNHTTNVKLRLFSRSGKKTLEKLLFNKQFSLFFLFINLIYPSLMLLKL